MKNAEHAPSQRAAEPKNARDKYVLGNKELVGRDTVRSYDMVGGRLSTTLVRTRSGLIGRITDRIGPKLIAMSRPIVDPLSDERYIAHTELRLNHCKALLKQALHEILPRFIVAILEPTSSDMTYNVEDALSSAITARRSFVISLRDLEIGRDNMRDTLMHWQKSARDGRNDFLEVLRQFVEMEANRWIARSKIFDPNQAKLYVLHGGASEGFAISFSKE